MGDLEPPLEVGPRVPHRGIVRLQKSYLDYSCRWDGVLAGSGMGKFRSRMKEREREVQIEKETSRETER